VSFALFLWHLNISSKNTEQRFWIAHAYGETILVEKMENHSLFTAMSSSMKTISSSIILLKISLIPIGQPNPYSMDILLGTSNCM